MTTERPMFPPVDSARRRFLTNAAGAAASGTVLSLATISPPRAAAAPNPTHAAIQRHQSLARACHQAVKLRARCKDFGTLTEEEEARLSELNDLVLVRHETLAPSRRSLRPVRSTAEIWTNTSFPPPPSGWMKP